MSWRDHFIQAGADGAARYREIIGHCTEQLAGLFEAVTQPYSGADPLALRRRLLDVDLSPATATSLEDVIREVRREIAAHCIIVQHPRCIAHLHTPPLLSGIAAESFIAAQNLSMDSWDQSGAATHVEQRVVNELCILFGYPRQADGVFTSGGTQSNIMALAIARDKFVWSCFEHDVQRDGLPECASRLRIIASEHSHFTVEKAASLMGLGQQSVIKIATHLDGAMDIDALERAILALRDDGLLPFAVVGTAGTTDHGAIDDLARIASIARRDGLWFHVDAAYGSALIVSRDRDRLTGIEHSDSVTVDFHKLWFQPVSCGALLLRDAHDFRHVRYKAEYLNRDTDDLPNLVDKTLSTTRRFDVLKVYMMLRAPGSETIGAMVDHLLAQTQMVSRMIRDDTHYELLASPCLTTVLFRYVDVDARASVDAFNRGLRSALLKNGIAVLGETVVNGQVALKLTILNPCLQHADFDGLLKEISRFAKCRQPEILTLGESRVMKAPNTEPLPTERFQVHE